MSDVSPVHPAELSDSKLLQSCRVERGRGSGAGGQHRNKVETFVRIVHEPTGVIGIAGERRSQQENYRKALFRLRLNLAMQVRGYREPGTSPGELFRSRCRGGKIAINTKHHDYPAILAEAIDIIEQKHYKIDKAAIVLDLTMSQLVKLIAKEPAALAMVNRKRVERKMRPLK